jgi:hypothetical protein
MTTQHDVKNLRTEVVENKETIKAASRLTEYYCLESITPKELDKVLSSDWPKYAELLTDLVPYGKVNQLVREAVAFILLLQMKPKKKGNYHVCDLAMSMFAQQPLYPTDLVVEWCDYRIRRATEELGMIEKVVWQVDDRNVPLQVELRNIGFRVMDYYRDEELMIFAR